MKLLFINIFIVFLIAGCSSKQYFEPQETHGNYKNTVNYMPEYIKEINKDGATLEDYRAVNKDGISKYSLPNGYTFLNKVDSIVIAANKKGQVLLKNKKNIINLEKNVVAATLKDNLLAIVYAQNSIALYDITTKKFKMKEDLKASLINDTRIANPVFLDDIVLYPSLDGKIVIVNHKTGAIIKNINIDPDGNINNIIFLKTIGETMVAATTNKLVSLGDGSFEVRDYTIKDITANNKNIFIATLDGNIIKLDLSLNVVAKKKFKFAKVNALAFSKYLYALEYSGYLIQLNSDFSKVKVFDFDFDNEAKTLAIGNTLYFDNKYIKLN